MRSSWVRRGVLKWDTLSFGLVKDYVVDPERFVKLASAPDSDLLTCAGFLL